jgi:glycosyltransferase involved in cell wall biosynthesis
MRVVFITGCFLPGACGAEDYAVLLAEALGQVGVEAHIVAPRKLNLLHAGSLIHEISRLNADVVHVQYPTAGYGKSLVPHAFLLLARNVPVLATLHEFSQVHFLRRTSILPFALRSQATVFTTEYERQSFLSWFPWTEKRSLVIPIGSNIPFFPGKAERDPLEVVHFGLIRPGKGLEDFLELAKLATNAQRPYRFTVVGSPVPRFASYLRNLKKSASGLPVWWKTGLSAEEVSRCLARSRFAYVPLPDGASERRGSLLAMLGNGMVLITTRGSQTPKELEEAVRVAATPSQALTLLDELAADTVQAASLSSKASEYASRFSWTNISRAHLHVYERILNGKLVRPGWKSKC